MIPTLGPLLPTAAPPPETAASLEYDFVLPVALLCVLIGVVSLTAIARCGLYRRSHVTGASPATVTANKGLNKKVLNSLPKFTYLDDNPVKWVVSSECAICISEFAAGEEVRVLPQCGHGFHVACVDTWLGFHSSCPSCRAPFVVARCQKCGLYQPKAAGYVAGETEPKSVAGENVQIVVSGNCVDRHSHNV